jgi:transposase
MTFSTATLPDSADALKEIILKLQAEFAEQLASARAVYEQQYDILLEQIHLLRAQIYGRKSEKIAPDNGAVQPSLFDMPEPAGLEPEPAKIEISGHTRRKRGRRPLPEHLPRIEVIHDIPETEKVCACGCALSRIGEEVSEQLDIVPARIQVIRNIRPQYACRNCEGVEDPSGKTVKIAPVHPQIIPKSIVSAGLLATILTGKFVDHNPFYRQEKQYLRLGVEISRTSMCQWAMQAAASCQPLLELLHQQAIGGFLINIDETPLQVLQEPGRSPTSKSYMWVFRGGDPENPVLIYEYHASRSGDAARKFLEDYQGVVQTDVFKGYDFLDSMVGIIHLGCWTHARRKFTDVTKAMGKDHAPGAADTALEYIGRLYRLEREARQKKLSTEEVYRMRQEQSAPIVKAFKKWLRYQSTQTPPKGLLGKAISYALSQWERLENYLKDGRLTMDNNLAENAIRPFVIGRKNWLFSGTPEGAAASATLYSLIETAKANGLEPYSYLRYIFNALPLAKSPEDYQALLPWNLTQAQLLG